MADRTKVGAVAGRAAERGGVVCVEGQAEVGSNRKGGEGREIHLLSVGMQNILTRLPCFSFTPLKKVQILLHSCSLAIVCFQ